MVIEAEEQKTRKEWLDTVHKHEGHKVSNEHAHAPSNLAHEDTIPFCVRPTRDTKGKCWSWITCTMAFARSWSARTRTSARIKTVVLDTEINLQERDPLSNGSKIKI